MLVMVLRLVAIGVGFIIIAIGVSGIYYSYVVYPTLIPGYGGSEPFLLSQYNNYSLTLPLYIKSRVHVEVYGNNTFNLMVDEASIGRGKAFSFDLEPGYHKLTVSSEDLVKGVFQFRQEPNTRIALISAFVIALGITGIFLIAKRE
ncbi:MAG: hypothetical protein DRJ33_05840 [Candidatus Methanomethylicota archaeon]|uniref:PEGA domain-containing protein n=1 Tax=Thermoproteota archaeon TaxID=2056631 RepID=A0A497EW77_9CREN|nr:MAG: hypothetical protein DRJ33_05840 [Candidatus Verstraetearchaeota archaeon]